MSWIKRNIEYITILLIVIVVMGAITILMYLGSKVDKSDPFVLRTFNVTLITGEKKTVSYQMNKASEVWVYTYKGSYWLEYNWHSKLGWNVKRAKAGVIDFEEIK